MIIKVQKHFISAMDIESISPQQGVARKGLVGLRPGIAFRFKIKSDELHVYYDTENERDNDMQRIAGEWGNILSAHKIQN